MVKAYFYRGRTYGNAKDYGQAISDFTKVIELKPDHTEAYTWRGIHLGELKHYQHAIKDFDKAIELEPCNGRLYFYRGNAYQQFTPGRPGLGRFKNRCKVRRPPGTRVSHALWD